MISYDVNVFVLVWVYQYHLGGDVFDLEVVER